MQLLISCVTLAFLVPVRSGLVLLFDSPALFCRGSPVQAADYSPHLRLHQFMSLMTSTTTFTSLTLQAQYQFLVNVLGGFAAWQKAGGHPASVAHCRVHDVCGDQLHNCYWCLACVCMWLSCLLWCTSLELECAPDDVSM